MRQSRVAILFALAGGVSFFIDFGHVSPKCSIVTIDSTKKRLFAGGIKKAVIPLIEITALNINQIYYILVFQTTNRNNIHTILSA